MLNKKNIALVTGGYSGEAVISYKSAITIEKNLDKELFQVYKIDINPLGWFHELTDGRVIEIDKNDFTLQIDNQKVKFDAVFIGLHGTPGEDGKLQGYFDTLKIPYCSCDAASSAITFNKRYTVAVAAMAGISVANSVHLFKHNIVDVEQISNSLQFPVFVKPNNGGSSIGMSKLSESSGLAAAIEKAFAEDDQVLVEEMISGREFTIGVFKSKGEVICLPITEIISNKDFFDYEAKYAGIAKEITPAIVDDIIAEKVRMNAKKIYNVFNCRGVVRIDFIYDEVKETPFMLEINTIPGQSDASIVPQQVAAMGWTLKEFYTKLIQECF
jgi:D-alanine-D-alanine ligase